MNTLPPPPPYTGILFLDGSKNSGIFELRRTRIISSKTKLCGVNLVNFQSNPES